MTGPTREVIAGLLSTLDFRPAEYHPSDCLPMADQILALSAPRPVGGTDGDAMRAWIDSLGMDDLAPIRHAFATGVTPDDFAIEMVKQHLRHLVPILGCSALTSSGGGGTAGVPLCYIVLDANGHTSGTAPHRTLDDAQADLEYEQAQRPHAVAPQILQCFALSGARVPGDQ